MHRRGYIPARHREGRAVGLEVGRFDLNEPERASGDRHGQPLINCTQCLVGQAVGGLPNAGRLRADHDGAIRGIQVAGINEVEHELAGALAHELPENLSFDTEGKSLRPRLEIGPHRVAGGFEGERTSGLAQLVAIGGPSGRPR